MNASHVRLPLSQIVPMEEPSARGLNTLCERNVVGQIHHNSIINYRRCIIRVISYV